MVVVAALLSVLGVGAATLWRSDVAPAASREVEELICRVGSIFTGGTCPDDPTGRPPADPALSVPHRDAAIAKAKALATPSTSAAPRLNDWDCKPGPVRPRPVILVHGIVAGGASMNSVAYVLDVAGYCAFALDHGSRGLGLGPLAFSAEQLRIFVDGVLAATGADRVSIVGHNGGAVVARQYVRFLGGAAKVDDLIGFGPANHGTTNPDFPVYGRSPAFQAFRDLTEDSPLLLNLNLGREVEPGVDYTMVATEDDDFITPYPSQFLAGLPDQVTNVTVQDLFPGRRVHHFELVRDWPTMTWMLDALSHPGPADPNFIPILPGPVR